VGTIGCRLAEVRARNWGRGTGRGTAALPTAKPSHPPGWCEGCQGGSLMPMPDYSLFGDEHVRRYEATGGKIGHDWNNTSCLVLHTIGRKSSETKKFPLIYGRDGNNYLIVASKGGAPDHPGWYKNLLAHPDVKIQVWDKVIPVRARTATADEKKRVWPIMTAQWPDYDKYQAGTKRDIPVVLLAPR
jgi:deazaflavin-dependent oxidoreductase (nitroreductase family)